ncbi:MAG TPA: lipid-A-disaccharide synthase [Gammaproteobacteria bacterium]
MTRRLRIGIVAGETSGDLLGADLIIAIRRRYPDAIFEGIGGPRMVAAGCTAIYPAEKLAVMGFVEVLRHLRELLSIRAHLHHHFIKSPPDIFIGIDAPDFNLALERRLKQAGIPAMHYVSPSVWAWRRGRLKKIGRSVDRMLTLFPFEAELYHQHHIPVTFVGHPLADQIPLEVDHNAARQQLGLPTDKKIIALLPGSRRSEMGFLGADFIRAARWLLQQRGDLHFVVPLVNATLRQMFEEYLRQEEGELPITLLDGHSHEAMAAADAVLLASGTATLEALLLKRPMVVAYRLAPLTYWLAKRLLRVPWYSLPNNLAGRKLVEEITQDEVTGENLGRALLELLDRPAGEEQRKIYNELHRQLRRDASERAADALLAQINIDIKGVVAP